MWRGAIPTGLFSDDKEAALGLVRVAFCKRAEVIAEAAGAWRRSADTMGR
jgi:hypothetical protein